MEKREEGVDGGRVLAPPLEEGVGGAGVGAARDARPQIAGGVGSSFRRRFYSIPTTILLHLLTPAPLPTPLLALSSPLPPYREGDGELELAGSLAFLLPANPTHLLCRHGPPRPSSLSAHRHCYLN